MNTYWISRIDIVALWGHQDYKLQLHEDVNIIIGPNASGKTTIINLLHHALTGNLPSLSEIQFKEITISLRSFDGDAKAVLRAKQTDEVVEVSYGDRTASLPFGTWRAAREYPERYLNPAMRRRVQLEFFDIKRQLVADVPAVWLPVSRRLPISEEEDMEHRRLHRRPLESVDECLADLLESLQRYRISLDSDLSELRKEFQRHALETILFDKQHDKAPDIRSFTPPTQEEKQQLQKAFTDVGLYDKRIEKRIDEHFAVAEEAAQRVKDGTKFDINTLFIFPLVNRTKSMVLFAREPEQKRSALFAPLESYQAIVNSFLNGKQIQVSDRGELRISPLKQKRDHLEWRQLSSGEKQILILLTQALIWERNPVVYVADEPELSLHVTWQEKLISSLKSLAGRCQFIVATHSPDIAGGFPDRIIDLGRA